MSSIRYRIFNLLKQGPLNDEMLIKNVGAPLVEVLNGVHMLINEGFVIFDGKVYRLRVVLDKSPTEVESKLELPRYSKYVDTTAKLDTSTTYDNPYLSYLAWALQGSRGTCTAHAGVVAYMLSYFDLTKDLPPKTNDNPCPTKAIDCAFVNELPSNYASAEWLYQKSREVGHVSIPSGSYCAYVCKVLTTLGVCSESTWNTSIEGCVLPEPKKASNESHYHLIDGIAEVDTWESCLSAIKNGKGVYGSYNVYAGSLSEILAGQTDTFTVNGNTAGQHANTFCRIRVKDGKTQIGSPQSWDCSRYTWIDKNYFENHSAKFYVLLDTEEVEFFIENENSKSNEKDQNDTSDSTPWWHNSGGLNSRKRNI